VYSRLRDLIVAGQLAPGSRLVEADLAMRLGVSRTPVRTALVKLLQESYVVSSGMGRKSRLSVTPLTSEDAREVWWIVAAMEALAARWAAELPARQRRELVRSLAETNEAMRDLVLSEERNPNRVFELDTEFHRCMVEASAGPRLLALHHSIKPHTERYWRLYTTSIVDRIDVSATEHDHIVAAIEAGEGEAASRAVEANWHNGAARLAKAIESLGERGSW
jgi:DNA-binding GntR family transcriptional regulator